MDSRNQGFKEELEQQPENAYLVNGTLPNEVLVHIDTYLPVKESSALSKACLLTHSIFQRTLNKLALALFKQLSQAVIDDDRETVKDLLGKNPSLVLYTPSKGIVIESQLTWQRFYLIEDILTIAVKRKQIEMIALLLLYYDQLEQTDSVKAAREKALSAWAFYEVRTNEQGDVEIIILQKYADYAQELIDVFKKESFPGGKLSATAEAELVSLFDKLLPEKAMKLDDYIDPELLLFAICKAYQDNFATFNYNWTQLYTLCIRVMGLIESVLAPGTAKIFCEGLNDVVSAEEKGVNKEISPHARKHKLSSGQSYYRSARDSHDGLGFSYFVSIYGKVLRGRVLGSGQSAESAMDAQPIAQTMLSKSNKFSELYAAINITAKSILSRP